ncbi:MAG: cytochrome c3 family protein [Alphaproteobacteria bacterium]|nr:cytochrome c3 family protein [Alphaproteobacteria bacterium]
MDAICREPRPLSRWLAGMALLFGLAALGEPASAERIADIRNTNHNFSVTGPGDVRATTEDEVCVFCHTPHAANPDAPGPLWNRALSTATYIPYSSSSLDAIGLDQPGGSSRLCLSCHDGTIAVGSVNVLNGAQTDLDPATADIELLGTAPDGTIPEGAGSETGFTRDLGVDLSNDHPISFDYDDSLALADGELRTPSSTPEIGDREPGGIKPELPLEGGQLQCTSCHDPHIRDTVETSIKFLRLNRLQLSPPFGASFDADNDILCLGCHDKDGWVDSAHAHALVSNEIYSVDAASLRDFPLNTQVWQAACLNCHDAHAVEGSRHLLREATNSLLSPKSGGDSALEETCYQCHGDDGGVLIGQGLFGFEVPDIRTEFLKPFHMPIDEQPEVHDIGTGGEPQPGRDGLESTDLLGRGGPQNRHAECTDCHNPHRVIKNRRFNDSPAVPAAGGTHDHGLSPSNIASGVLRGSWGVEPLYGSSAFLTDPIAFTVKRGNPPVGGSDAVVNSYLTREYQLCLKCHSNYAYDFPPSLGFSDGGTPPGTNAIEDYTNQAMEFQAPAGDRGEPGGNHRSWHPVIDSTGRSTTVRQASASAWLPPFNNPASIGNQTMFCSDCHGAETAAGTIEPNGGENGDPWGPHGSVNDFLLKGGFSQLTGGEGTEDHICFKCHSYTVYATRDGEDTPSGFGGSEDENLHAFHADRIERLRCTWCHAAVPHGWKNKALLVDLNDVGPEAGLAAGTQVRNNTTAGFTSGPYYLNALLKIRTFATSGNWEENNCGSAGPPGNGEFGRDWMRDSSENCENPP